MWEPSNSDGKYEIGNARSLIGSEIQKDGVFGANEDNLKNLVGVLDAKAEAVILGGGKATIEKHRQPCRGLG